MPALGRLSDVGTIRADLANMAVHEFKRGYLNLWLTMRRGLGRRPPRRVGGESPIAVYDREHQAVRRGLLAASSPTDPCWRCGFPLGPDPSRLDLGHRDDGPGWAGLEHAKCSRAAGARKGNALRVHARAERRTIVAECAIALEISEDRQHCSIVAAGHLPGDLILLELGRLPRRHRPDRRGAGAARATHRASRRRRPPLPRATTIDRWRPPASSSPGRRRWTW
jgi:hypothetical protein